VARILVGLSGGVDSSVAAALLLEQGHEVVGGYMKNWINEEGLPGDCPWERDLEDAHAVAQTLGIEFRVIDLIDQYRQRIVDYLLEGYRDGITPNPDVMCNREMKFGVFLDYALEQGFAGVGTGHYARARNRPDDSAVILRGADPNKDQSYFLAMMTQRQVKHAFFPAGEMLKPEVRDAARRFGLPTAEKKDSQGICFIGNIKMTDFLRHYVPDSPGEIVDLEGRVMGQHEGLHLYTLGQRKGHGVASPREGWPMSWLGKIWQRTNWLSAGMSQIRSGFILENARWVPCPGSMSPSLRGERRCSRATAQNQKGLSCELALRENWSSALLGSRGLSPRAKSVRFMKVGVSLGEAFLSRSEILIIHRASIESILVMRLSIANNRLPISR